MKYPKGYRTALMLTIAVWVTITSGVASATTYATPVCPQQQGCVNFLPSPANTTVAATAYVQFYSGFPYDGELINSVTTVTGNTVQISASYIQGTGFPEGHSPPYNRQFLLPLLPAGTYDFELRIAPDPSYPNPPPVITTSGPVAAGVSMSATLVVGSASPTGITPQVGLWWNPNESGSGYAFDVKHGVLVATIYSYTLAGPPIWYLAFGPIDSNNTMTGTLFKYASGQCISCTYVPPVDNGNDGTVTIQFTSPTSATMTLPNRAPFTVIPEEF